VGSYDRRLSSGVTSADLVVVGAGILGLAVAREALLRYDGLSVLVLEKEDRVAVHQTGHSSGVVHSGIYYAPGSLKARLCVRGSRALYAYCEEHGIATERCGKVVVASDERDLARLDDIHARARANGVEGVTLLDEDDLREVEPAVSGLRALHSPATGIVDFRQVASAFADEIVGLGAAIRLRSAVHAISRAGDRAVSLTTTGGPVEARVVITCAGLHSDRLARMTGGSASPRIVPFRGRYHALSADASGLVRGLVYPVPDPSFPFLGVHLTKQISGEVWAGPNAVLALAREGYRGWDVNVRDLWETLSYSGFRTLARRYWRAGFGEMRGDLSKHTFVRALQRLVPSMRVEYLAGMHAGVRAQALSSDGELLDDFWFDRAERVLHLRNAPSPAATSSLALAEEVVRAAEEFLAAG
jgi:L-2-hydroxyglutarate oxidase LhgO